MEYLDLFLKNGVRLGEGNSHPLDYMMRLGMRGYMVEEDSLVKEEEGKIMERTAGLMKNYKPELLQKYYTK